MSYKDIIVKALKWALSKFEPKPTLKEQLTAWPFPGATEDFEPRPCKIKAKKVSIPKATTRKPAAKKVVKKKAK